MVASISIAYYNNIIGLLFGILSLLIITGREGITINNEKRKLKYYWGIFGLKFGVWEDLPDFSRVSVSGRIKIKKDKKVTSSREFEVKLWFKEFEDYILAYTGNYEDCREKADNLSKMLNLRIVDMAKTNGKAVKKQ